MHWKKKPPKMKHLLKLRNSIFSHMNYEWKYDITAERLDMLFKMYYGERNPSPVVDYVAEENDIDIFFDPNDPEKSQLTEDALSTIAELLLMTYKPKWDKLGNIYDTEYDPIHNYIDEWEDHSKGEYADNDASSSNRTDTFDTTVTDDKTRTDNLTSQLTYGRSDLRTDNLSQSDSGTDKRTTTNTGSDGLYGFNSATAVGHDTSSNTESTSGENSNTRTNSGTQTNARTGTDTTKDTGTQTTNGETAKTGTEKRSESGTDKKDGTDSRDRNGWHKGNIANLTSQKQLQEEIDLWKWNYVNTILEDAKKMLTLDVYLS